MFSRSITGLLIAVSCSVYAGAHSVDLNIKFQPGTPDSVSQRLASQLATITGIKDLRFDSDGGLTGGGAAEDSGSHTARELLARAQRGPNRIFIEDASGRNDVVFGKVVEGRWLRSTAHAEAPAYVIYIDFADFGHLIGDRKTLDAFNEAWGFLHELAHVVENSNDAETLGDLGDCEEMINQMRRELSLEERGEYFYTAARGSGDFATQLVRLEFIEKRNDGRTKRHWLMWDARLVGSGIGESQRAISRR